MDLKTFIENFEDAVDGIEPGSLSEATAFRELKNWDSLAILTVIDMIDAEYQVTVNAADFQQCATLKELFELVKKRKKA
ncbi:MAG: acyl carrier protein [Opitutales bacterium]